MCENCNKLHPKLTPRRRVRVYTVLDWVVMVVGLNDVGLTSAFKGVC